MNKRKRPRAPKGLRKCFSGNKVNSGCVNKWASTKKAHKWAGLSR